MLKIRCSCGGFLESHRWIVKWNEVLFRCWKCGRVEFHRRGELGKLVDMDTTLDFLLQTQEVRNLAVFGLHSRSEIEQSPEQVRFSRISRLSSVPGS